MSFTHSLSTNNYGPAKFIVATSAANGTHTTLASAMAAASVGDTIFLRDSVTENVTITPGVNIACWQGSSNNTPSITGKLTMTGAGVSTIKGITLITNSDFAIAVTGSAASILNIVNCYMNALNNTAISFTSSSGSSKITLALSTGDIGTTGIALFASSSSGILEIDRCHFGNSGSSLTANTLTAGQLLPNNSVFSNGIAVSNSSSISGQNNVINTAGNQTALSFANTSSGSLQYSTFISGTATAITIASGCTLILNYATVASSNGTAISGAGTLNYDFISYVSTGGNTVTTQGTLITQPGLWKLAQTQVASASASLTFTISALSSTYNEYMLVFNNVIAASAGGQALRLRYNQGSGVVTTGYNGQGMYTDTSGGPAASGAVTTYAALGIALGNAAPAVSGNCLIGNTLFVSSTGATYNTNVANSRGNPGSASLGGIFGNTAAITAFEVSMASGNIAQGTFSLYGLAV